MRFIVKNINFLLIHKIIIGTRKENGFAKIS